ncbi:MAG: thioredoxin domain-containing protein [Actinomycetota bacterium]
MVDKKADKKKSLKKSRDNSTRYLVIGMIVFVVVAGIGATLAKNHSNSHVALPSLVSKTDGYGIAFNPTAKVKVDMWEDFRCPNCRNFEAQNNTYVDNLVREGKINAVYHPMSFIAPDSILTAAAAACAGDQGKFLEMHTALYVNQPTDAQSAENSAYWTNAQLILLGNSIGITSKTFATCINSGKYINWTRNIEADAASKNINATPTVVVNGKTLPLATDYDAAAFAKVFTNLGIK